MRTSYLLIILILVYITACDKGLSPELTEPEAGFGGTVTFSGDWDPSITQTHIVVFKNPLLSVSDFNVFNLSFVSEAIPNGSQLYQYTTNEVNSVLSTIGAGSYSYVAVAQSFSDTISLNRSDWIVVGIYRNQNDLTQPGIITVPDGSFVDSINIYVDFNNPPEQPPGENSYLNLLNRVKDINNYSKMVQE